MLSLCQYFGGMDVIQSFPVGNLFTRSALYRCGRLIIPSARNSRPGLCLEGNAFYDDDHRRLGTWQCLAGMDHGASLAMESGVQCASLFMAIWDRRVIHPFQL